MKVTQSYWKENSDDRRDNRASRAAEAQRHNIENQARAAAKSKQAESTLKDDLKFAGILKSAENPQKTKPTEEDSSQKRRDDDKDKKRADRQKDSAKNVENSDRVEQYGQSNGGGNFGGSSGFGGDVNQAVHLSENFAARSILHIADLERIISAIRTQTALGGKREVYLELKRSVLKGLKVKITIDAARQTQIEFHAADEQTRSQIENHSEELAEILRGRGINPQSLRCVLVPENAAGSSQLSEPEMSGTTELTNQNSAENFSDDNTFAGENEASIYRA